MTENDSTDFGAMQQKVRAIQSYLVLLEESGLVDTQVAYLDMLSSQLFELEALIQRATSRLGTSSGVVLVVDDDATQRLWAGNTLVQAGYEVKFAADGREAIECASKENFTAILMDCEIPDMDGFDAAARIVKINLEKGRETPVVAFSSYSIPGYPQRCKQVGMREFLKKPASREALLSCIAKAIQD